MDYDLTVAIVLIILFIILSAIDIVTKYKKCITTNLLQILPVIFVHRFIYIFMYFTHYKII